MNSPIGLGFCSLDRAMPVWLSLFLLMRYFTDLRRSHIFILKKVGDGSVAAPGRQKTPLETDLGKGRGIV